MKILGEKYSKNELIFIVYFLASSRCLEALGLKNIDAIIDPKTTDDQKRDYCAMLATYLGSTHKYVAKAREGKTVEDMTAMYELMAQTGKKIMDIAKAREAADAGQGNQ